ncbi:hypothetical protein F5050DRAFT_1576772 [Lentinula boryana]|uniref:CBF1-interacting co-repressor CIR N-terminal domain-containing protein n=1 Tax=Lentinula boryana TaxID=40481 RepID=A0ABQ8Q5V4_9AGAR|nr:hypothetical protein F5050DRAFT_1576772 [Lentinula boryana]
MGKLNIAHHKSYHPYRRDNIEKVRRDEEEARLQEAKEEGRMLLADSEARIDLLRQKSGSSKKKVDDELRQLASSSTAAISLSNSGGHINFFEDLEQNAIVAAAKASKKNEPAETDKGIALAPSAKDLNPWYSGSSDYKDTDANDDKRKRDTARKSIHDPLTSINHQLASTSTQSSIKPRFSRPRSPKFSSQAPEVSARLSRESTERERALALVRRKKKEMIVSDTPSTIRGGDESSEYGDMYNKRDVEEAHRLRDRRWDDYRPRRRNDDYRH